MVVELLSLDGGSFAIVAAIERYDVDLNVSWDAELPDGAPVPFCVPDSGRGFGDAYNIVRYIAGRGDWAPPGDPLIAARQAWVARFVVDELAPLVERLLLVERIAPGMGREVAPELREQARDAITAANPRWLGRSHVDILEQSCATGWVPRSGDNPTAIVVAGYAAVLRLAGLDLAPWPTLSDRVGEWLSHESFRDQVDHAETILRGDDGIVDA